MILLAAPVSQSELSTDGFAGCMDAVSLLLVEMVPRESESGVLQHRSIAHVCELLHKLHSQVNLTERPGATMRIKYFNTAPAEWLLQSLGAD